MWDEIFLSRMLLMLTCPELLLVGNLLMIYLISLTVTGVRIRLF